MIRRLSLLLTLLTLSMLVPSATAQSTDAPDRPIYTQTLTLAAGEERTVEDPFTANTSCDSVATRYTLVVKNGNPDLTGMVEWGAAGVNGLDYVDDALADGASELAVDVPLQSTNLAIMRAKAPANSGAVLKIEIWRKPVTVTNHHDSYAFPQSTANKNYTVSFTAADPSLPAMLIVTRNGGLQTSDQFFIKLNNINWLSRTNFNATSQTLTVFVPLLANNTLKLDAVAASQASDVIVRVVQHGPDTTHPTLTLNGTIPTKLTTNSYTFTGNATDTNKVASLTLNGTNVSFNSGNGSFTTTATLTHGAPNEFTFLAYDCAGLGTKIVNTIEWDRDAPNVTVTSPAPNAFVKGTLTVNGTATDDTSGIPVVKVNGVTATWNGATWTANITLAAPDGAKSITVVATDSMQRATTVVVPVTRDGTPPTISGSIAPPKTSNGWSALAAVVTFTCADAVSGIASCTSPVTLEEAGSYAVSGTAVDLAGNQKTLNYAVKVDNEAPELTINGATAVVNQSPLALDGMAFDADSGVVSLSFNGVPATLNGEGFTFSQPLEPGTNVITAVALDAVGLEDREVFEVKLDQQQPQLTITAPQDGAQVAGPTIEVRGTAADDDEIFTIKVNGDIATFADGEFTRNVTLTGGANTITVEAKDRGGNVTTQSVTVTVDETPPTITATLSPQPNADGWNSGPVTVTFTCDDSGSGVATCNGPITTTTEGEHQVTATATDNAGNVATVNFTVKIDTTPPAIAPSGDRPMSSDGWTAGDINFEFICLDDGSGIATCSSPVLLLAADGQQTVTGTAVDKVGNSRSAVPLTVKFDTVAPILQIAPVPGGTSGFQVTLQGTVEETLSGLHAVTCDNATATVNNGAFQCIVSLASGTNAIAVVATDRAANRTESTVNVTVDEIAPVIVIVSPEANLTTSDETVRITGEVTDNDVIATLTIAGTAISPSGTSFAADVSLHDGINDIAIVATDRAGNASTQTLRVTRFAVPKITITTPIDLAVVRDAVTTVTGTINNPNAAVSVNDVPATVTNGTFQATDIPLAQGRTVITATATDTLGRVAVASINIYRDSIPPRLTVNSPEDGAIVYSSPISISGVVDDIVVGTINANQMQVTVNNQPAQVSNRAFFYPDLALAPGLNTIDITALDEGGNRTVLTYRVTLATAAKPRVILVSGDAQTAAIGNQLDDPIIAQALSPAGAPLAGVALTFEIVENDGMLHTTSSSARRVTVLTGADGRASVDWSLGMRAGAGNNRLRISGSGFAAPIETAAVALAATPALIVVDAGNDQFAVTGDPLPRPLVAVVVDAGNNRLADVPVTFMATGGGSFDGQSSITINTDSDGRAIVTPTAGAEPGQDNNIYVASVAGVAEPATFRASGKLPGLPAETRIVGVVLDNTQIPIEGVTVRIDGTSVAVQTDVQGQFTIQPAPVGYVKLFVDGTTAHRPGTWPTLEYAMYTLAGIDNDVATPIYLLPIDTARGLFVDDTTGGTLTLPELPGFALKVAPGSVTFPGGGRTGTVSATLVHADRIPMAPGFGQQPTFIITIQPAGAHFDPPAQLTFPNTDGLRPSEVTEMYSFDHDLGQFIAIGTATVSPDGATLTSDPGVGIIKGGWHCGGNPTASGACEGDGGGGCVPKIDGSCDHPNEKPCKSYVCKEGECTEVDRYRMEVKFVNRDDASRASWDFRQTLPEGSPLYGGYGGDTTTADWVRFEAIQTGADHTTPNYTWKATGPSTINGPSGSGSEFRLWELEGIMWKPGEYEVSCTITYGEGCEQTITWIVDVGIRTGEYIVTGGIMREDEPEGLDISTAQRVAMSCPIGFPFVVLNATFGWPNETDPEMPEPWSDLPRDSRIFTMFRIIQVTSNDIIDPDPNGTPANNYALSGGRNFRFLARAQYKFLVNESGSFHGNPQPVGPILTRVGATTAPCGTSWTGLNIPGENPAGNGRQYLHDGKWTMQLYTRASLIDRVGYERLTHRELPYVGVRLRFRPDSALLASDLNNPSQDWQMRDERDFSMMPTISFYRRFWTRSGGWQVERLHRTTQRVLDFTAIGPVTREPAFLP